MSIVTKSILKGYFETGDRPTEGQFIDLIDSLAVLGTNTNDITFVGTVTATTGSFGYLDLTGGSNFNSIDVGGGYGNTGLTVTSTGQLSTDDYILTETYVSASTFLSTPKIKSPSTDFIIIQNAITVQGSITASGHITASTLQIANNAQFGESTVYINSPLGDISASGRISASGGFEAGQTSTSSFGYISASGDISASGNVYGNTGSFGHLKGDGSGLTGVTTDGIHGNKPSTTGSITIPENTNNTVVTNNTGEFTINDDYTVKAGAQVDLQYTPIAERLYRYDVDTGTFKAYAQANIDSETTLIKGFGAATAGVGNDSTVRHNATVPENFVTILHTTTNVTQSEDPNNNPMTTDPHSITIQDQSTYTVKLGADVTVDGVHHGVIRKDIALFSTLGIGDTQAIGPTGSEHFNDQLARIYPSASAHLHISASNPRVIVEATFGAPEVSLLNSSSNHAGFLSFKEGSNKRSDDKWESEFRFSYNANEATKPFRLQQINKTGSSTHIFQIFSGSSANALTITGSRIGIGTMDPQATLYVEGDISASGTVTALSGSFSELSGMSPLTVNGETIFTGPITASGDVSSSGNIDVNQINSRGQRVATFDGQQMLLGSNSINTSIVGASIFLGPVLGAITASGEISSSSDITGVTGSFEGGLVLTSPNGTKYRFTTNDSGHLSLTGSAI